MNLKAQNLPNKAYIDICSHCNHKCTFCSNSDGRTVKSKLSLNEFKTILDNILDATGLKSLGLYSKGEPFLNQDIFSMIDYAKKSGIGYVFLTTNGSLLDTTKNEQIFSCGLDSIKFSVNATDKESYYKIHQKDCFETVTVNIQEIIRLKKVKNSALKVLISVVSNDLSKYAVENFYKNLLGKDYAYLDLIIVNKIGYTPKQDKLSKTCHTDMKDKCPRPFDEINVTATGQLNLCCMDFFEDYNFGDLKNNSLKELWFSKQFEAIRKMHQNGKFPKNHLCYSCLLTRDLTSSLKQIKKSIGQD